MKIINELDNNILEFENNNSIINILKNNYSDKNNDNNKSYSFKLAKILSQTYWGDIILITNIILNLLAILVYIINSYFESQIIYFTIFDLISNIFFIFSYFLYFYISVNKFSYLLSFMNIINLLSLIPNFLTNIGVVAVTQLSFSRVFRILRFILIIHLEKFLTRYSSDSNKYLFRLIHSIFSIVLINSALMHYVEFEQQLKFHQWIYFSIVTLSVVGFGDIYPHTVIGQIVIIVVITSVLVKIPVDVSEFTKSLSIKKIDDEKKYKNTNKNEFIVILGSITFESLKVFWDEIYNDDHGNTSIETIILCEEKFQENYKSFWKINSYYEKLYFFDGSMNNFNDLNRISIQNCSSVIFLANKNVKEPIKEDKKNIIGYLSVKTFVKRYFDKDIRICLKLLKLESKDLFYKIVNNTYKDEILCMDELKLYLLSKTSLCPGIITILSILITYKKPSLDILNNKNEDNWMYNYLYGVQNELYCLTLDKIEGISFKQLCKKVYSEYNVIIIAIELKIADQSKLFINPINYIFGREKYNIYIIAAQKPYIDKEKLNLKVNNNNFYIKNKRKKEEFYNLKNRINLNSNDSLDLSNFYFTKIQSLQDNTLNYNNNNYKFENHIIICGMHNNLHKIIYPLRSKILDTIDPIIIINNEMPVKIWVQIYKFPKIYFYKGNYASINDLEKIGVYKAQSILIISKIKENEKKSEMLDLDIIFIYKNINSAESNIKIITELSSSSTINFLTNTKNNKLQFAHWLTEAFASGNFYFSSILDSLISQAYYNPSIDSLINQLILGYSYFSEEEKKYYDSWGLQTSNLFIYDLPTKYENFTFEDLFRDLLLEFNIILIGIYKENPENNNFKHYVYLKPFKKLKLTLKDKIYVLSSNSLMNFQSNSNYKSKVINDLNKGKVKTMLIGEEGKIDLEMSKKLVKLNDDLDELKDELKDFSEILRNNNLINNELLNNLKLNL